MRAIPDDNLAYPVFVTLGNGATGSGFFLNMPDYTYLVTAKHVLFNNDSLISPSAFLLSYPKDLKDKGTITLKLELTNLESSGNILSHLDRDVALVRIFQSQKHSGAQEFAVQSLDGVSLNCTAKSGFVGVSPESTKMLDEVLVANEVITFGYPTSIGLKDIPQLDYQRPLLRKGIVAATYPDRGTVILDCPIYGGNSGGMVMELERQGLKTSYKVIGIVSQFIPYSESWVNTSTRIEHLEILNSGYSVAVGMDSVFDLI